MNVQSITNNYPMSNIVASELRTKAVVETKLIEDVTKTTNVEDTQHQNVNTSELTTAVDKVQQYIEPFNNNIEFSINKDTNQIVIKVIDKQTQEVIKQIPSEEMIEMAKALDKIKGILVKQKA